MIFVVPFIRIIGFDSLFPRIYTSESATNLRICSFMPPLPVFISTSVSMRPGLFGEILNFPLKFDIHRTWL